MEKEPKFGIRGYQKSELAQMYHPNVKATSAMRKMNRWINRNKELKRRLSEVQVSLMNHKYTSREVAILVEFLGEP